MASKVFGYQLLLDLYNCKKGVCDDLDYCYKFLDESVGVLGMQKQSPPSIFVSPKEFPEKAGLSGWCPLIESHIAIHTLAPKDYISIDIYSCKEYDPKAIEKYVTEYFGAEIVDSQYIKRGFNYFRIIKEESDRDSDALSGEGN